jgi:hypothetical protein
LDFSKYFFLRFSKKIFKIILQVNVWEYKFSKRLLFYKI